MTDASTQLLLDRALPVLQDSGLFHVTVYYKMRALGEPVWEIHQYDNANYTGFRTKTFSNRREFELFLEDLPTAEQRAKQIFHKSITELIEKGKDAGIDEALLTGLIATHEALTTNLLTYERGAVRSMNTPNELPF